MRLGTRGLEVVLFAWAGCAGTTAQPAPELHRSAITQTDASLPRPADAAFARPTIDGAPPTAAPDIGATSPGKPLCVDRTACIDLVQRRLVESNCGDDGKLEVALTNRCADVIFCEYKVVSPEPGWGLEPQVGGGFANSPWSDVFSPRQSITQFACAQPARAEWRASCTAGTSAYEVETRCQLRW